MEKKLKVYISSISFDLVFERYTTESAIRDVGHIPIYLNDSSLNDIYKSIDESDVYILILGGCYEFMSKKSGLSFMEHEYMYALQKYKYILPIVLSDSFISYNGISIFQDTTNYSYIKFKTKVLSNSVAYVNNLKDIYYSVSNFLLALTKEHLLDLHKTDIIDDPLHLLSQYKILLSSDSFNITESFKNFIKTLGIKFIPDVSVNKCVLDPLGNPIHDIENIRVDVREINDIVLNCLKKNPTDLYQLSSRRFEELVAEILIRKGYKVELTTATRDGGKDIYAARKDDLGSFLYVVECKKYNPNHKVGVNVLRDLYGVIEKEQSTYGVVVTTSYFSKPAQEYQQDIQFRMALRDFEAIKKWLCDVTNK